MGSLMGGWNSRAVLERNKSMTKEEIEAFRSWQHKMHEKPASGQTGIEGDSPTAAIIRSSYTTSSPPQQQYMSETPEAMEQQKRCATSFEDNQQQFHKANANDDWWTRSKWAFLNEPPVDDESAHKYAAQFHVANLSTT